MKFIGTILGIVVLLAVGTTIYLGVAHVTVPQKTVTVTVDPAKAQG